MTTPIGPVAHFESANQVASLLGAAGAGRAGRHFAGDRRAEAEIDKICDGLERHPDADEPVAGDTENADVYRNACEADEERQTLAAEVGEQVVAYRAALPGIWLQARGFVCDYGGQGQSGGARQVRALLSLASRIVHQFSGDLVMASRERTRTQVCGKHASLRMRGHREAHSIVFGQLLEGATQSHGILWRHVAEVLVGKITPDSASVCAHDRQSTQHCFENHRYSRMRADSGLSGTTARSAQAYSSAISLRELGAMTSML